MPTKTSEVEVATGEIIETPSGSVLWSELKEALVNPNVRLTVADTDADAAQADITRQILEAADPLAPKSDPVNAEEIAGQKFMLTGVDWRNSDLEASQKGIYAVLHGLRPNGDAVIVTTGSANVMAALANLAHAGAFPVPVVVVRAKKPTRGGYYPFWLERCTWDGPDTF